MHAAVNDGLLVLLLEADLLQLVPTPALSTVSAVNTPIRRFSAEILDGPEGLLLLGGGVEPHLGVGFLAAAAVVASAVRPNGLDKSTRCFFIQILCSKLGQAAELALIDSGPSFLTVPGLHLHRQVETRIHMLRNFIHLLPGGVRAA